MSQSLTSKLLFWFISLLAAFLAGVGLIFLALVIKRSTLPYNSEGNYFDGVVNYHEQAVEVYGVLAGVSFLAVVLLFGFRLLVQRKAKGNPLKTNSAPFLQAAAKKINESEDTHSDFDNKQIFLHFSYVLAVSPHVISAGRLLRK